jgi:hypothetical protein
MAEILPRCTAESNNQGAHHPRTINKIPNENYSSKAMDVAFYKTVIDVHGTDMAPPPRPLQIRQLCGRVSHSLGEATCTVKRL